MSDTQNQKIKINLVSNYSELNGSVKQVHHSGQPNCLVSNYSELNGSVKTLPNGEQQIAGTTVSNYSELNGSVKMSVGNARRFEAFVSFQLFRTQWLGKGRHFWLWAAWKLPRFQLFRTQWLGKDL